MDNKSPNLPRLAPEKVIAYLQHLGVQHVGAELPKPTLSLLREMQQRHHDKIPFESVTIHLAKNKTYKDSDPIPYQEGMGNVDVHGDALFDKIVTRGMGGYCFECNGLFAMVLRTLGYHTTDVCGRVYPLQGKTPDEAGWAWTSVAHQTTLVHFSHEELSDDETVPKDWKAPHGGQGVTFHCDVGFGVGQPREPMLLGSETHLSTHVYERLPPLSDREDVPYGYTLYRKLYDRTGNEADASKFKLSPLYHYMLQPQSPGDYHTASWMSNTWPHAVFVKQLMATVPFGVHRGDLPEESGRHSLLYSQDEQYGGRKEGDGYVAVYKRKGFGAGNVAINEERVLTTFGELKKLLREIFGIDTDKMAPTELSGESR